MTTEKKLAKTIEHLERMRENDNVSDSFKDGILFSINQMKIWFYEDLENSGIDSKIDFYSK